MAKGGSGDVLSGMIAAMVGWCLREFTGITWREREEEGLPELVHIVSKLDPEAQWIKEKYREYEKAHDPKFKQELQTTLKRKMTEALTLINCVSVSQAVYLHGLAGDIARDLYGERSMVAGDIINCIGEAFAVCEDQSYSKFAYIQR